MFGGGVIGVLNTGLPEGKSSNTGIPDLKFQNTGTGMDSYDHAVMSSFIDFLTKLKL
jgi:hypothetical protein